jgi:hypothetical protein
MVSTRKRPKGRASQPRDGFPPELHTELRKVHRDHPRVDPGHLLHLMWGLGYGHMWLTYGAEGELLRVDVGSLELLRRRLAAEPQRSADWKELVLRNKRIQLTMNFIQGLGGLGGPRHCQECGARTADERTVWCPAGCRPGALDSLPRGGRVRAELQAAKFPPEGAPAARAGPRR